MTGRLRCIFDRTLGTLIKEQQIKSSLEQEPLALHQDLESRN